MGFFWTKHTSQNKNFNIPFSICSTCSYFKWVWCKSQYNKLFDLQYARFLKCVAVLHVGFVLITWYPHHEHYCICQFSVTYDKIVLSCKKDKTWDVWHLDQIRDHSLFIAWVGFFFYIFDGGKSLSPSKVVLLKIPPFPIIAIILSLIPPPHPHVIA